MKLGSAALTIALMAIALPTSSCKRSTEVVYASYEDCILGKLGRGQSTVASEAIIAACRAKFPSPSPGKPATSEQSAALFDDVLLQPAPKTFHGHPCTVDCSGHEAGYAWAKDHDILDAAYCSGRSQSFVDGCIAWVSEQAP